MKHFLDFFSLIIFFTVYKLYDIFFATGALISVTFAAFIYHYYAFRKIKKTMLVTVSLVSIFGGLTLYFHNPNFIKWKVTIIYLLLASGLIINQFFFKKSLIQSFLAKEISLPQAVWRKLSTAWALFFISCGLINIYIIRYLSEKFWINFKVFGLTGMTLLFTAGSGIYIYFYLHRQAKNSHKKSEKKSKN